jgi:predicted phage terminase large subunit-like protein
MHGTLKKKKRPPNVKAYTPVDLEVLEQLAAAEARDNFWYFRRYMRPDMEVGWFQCEMAYKLQKFYTDWKAGLAPILILNTPPQHGKSWMVADFIAWCQGHDPDSRVIFASFSDRLGKRTNLMLQRWFLSPRYQRVFPEMSIVVTAEDGKGSAGVFQRNMNILEYSGHEGSFRNTTVNGAVRGEGLDLGVVDDPIKGRAEGNSKLHRDKTWEWFTDDFFGRFSKRAALILIVTRYHLDDPVGRLEKNANIFSDGQLTKINYPALGRMKNGKWIPEDNSERAAALFPELKPKTMLLQRKGLMTKSGWESEYQGSPILAGGGMFPIDKFRIERERPGVREIRKSVRYWDKAGTEGGGAFTAGVLMDELKDGRVMVSDVRRGQWSALERETRIKQTAEIDNSGGRRCEVWVEQEPGSGGKESAERTILNLRGFTVKADRVTGAKEIRAEPYAAQVQAGNVLLLAAPWNRAFLDEHETYPAGTYLDQVDAAGGAFMKVTGGIRLSFDHVR